MSRAEGFAAVPNWMIRDRRVPRNAILVYASLSSRAGMGAIFPSQATIAEESGLSERTVRTMLKSLEEIGVVERRVRRGVEGKSTARTDAYTLHPNGRDEEPATVAGRSKGPANGGQGTGNQAQVVPLIEVDREEVDRDTREVSLMASVSFDDFWSAWPRKASKPDALRAWNKAVKTVPGEVILSGAIAYRDNPARPDKEFIPYPATWLNRAGWDDDLPEARGGRVGAVDAGREADAILAERERLAVGA